MDEENPELRSLEQEAPATECLEEFVLGIPVKPYSEPSMSDVLSSSSSKKYSSNYHEASGAHHHLAASCSEVVFVFDGFQDKLRIRMLPFGEHRGDGSTAGLSKLFDVDLKNEVIVSGMSFFPYSAGSSYYGLILIPVESGAIYLYYLGEEGLVYHKETGQPLRAIFKLNAPAPPSAFEKSQIRPPLLNCMELTSSGRFGSISTAGASWREQGQSEHHNGNAIYTMKQEISVVAHYHFTGNIVQNNADTRLGLVLYRFYVDPDPLATDLPKEEARELIDGENITISIEKPGLGGLVRSIFSERSPSFNSRTVVESIRNLGDYLLGMILNCEGQYQACILNLKSCQVISKLDLPSIASDFAYDMQPIDFDPSSPVSTSTESMAVVISQVIRLRRDIWRLNNKLEDAKVYIWRFSFRQSFISRTLKGSGPLRKEVNSPNDVVGSSCEELSWNKMVIMGVSLSSDYLIMYGYNMLEFRNEAYCYKLDQVGYKPICIYTQDDKLIKKLLEDKSASSGEHALDLRTYLHQRLFESSRFSLETLQRVLEHFETDRVTSRDADRCSKLAKCQTKNQLAELYSLKDGSGLSLDFNEDTCIALISRCTALELSNWIVHVSQSYSETSPALVVRANGSISFFVKVSNGHEVLSLIDSVKVKGFIREHASLYLKLRCFGPDKPGTKSDRLVFEHEAKAIENRLKDVETVQRARDLSLEAGLPQYFSDRDSQTAPEYLLSLQRLISDNRMRPGLYNLLWFLVASIVDDKKAHPGRIRNWSSTLSFCFDRLLSGVDKLHIYAVVQMYRSNRELLDGYFEQTMHEFITALKFRPVDDKTIKSSEFGVPASQGVAASILNRLCEAKAEHILLCLFHFRVMESHLGARWMEAHARTAILRDLAALNIQSVLGLYYVSSQLTLDSNHGTNGEKRYWMSPFVYGDQESILLKQRNLSPIDELTTTQPLEYAKRVLGKLLYFYPNISMEIFDAIHDSVPDRNTFLQFSQFLTYNHPALSYYKGVELPGHDKDAETRSVQELIRVLTFLLTTGQTSPPRADQPVPKVDYYIYPDGRSSAHYSSLVVDLKCTPWFREVAASVAAPAENTQPADPTKQQVPPTNRLNTFLEKAILELQKRSVSNSCQGSFAHVICGLSGLDPHVVGLAYASAIKSVTHSLDQRPAGPSVEPLLPLKAFSDTDIETILTKSLSSDSDTSANIGKLAEYLSYNLKWETVSKTVHSIMDRILEKLNTTVSQAGSSQTAAHCKHIAELALGLYQVNFRRKDINKIVLDDYRLLLGLAGVYQDSKNTIKAEARKELHSLMLNCVERIRSVLMFYSPGEAAKVINSLAESKFVLLSCKRANASAYTGLQSLFSTLGFNTKTTSLDQSTALNADTFDAAHTFLTVALKLDAYQVSDAQRCQPNLILASLLVHDEHSLAVSLAKHYPPLWKSFWVITLRQLTLAVYNIQQQPLVKHLLSSLAVCPPSFSLGLVEVLHADWFVSYFHTNNLADEAKQGLKILERKLIERHGLEFVRRLLDMGDMLAAATALKHIVRINRQLATQKTFTETRRNILTAGSMDEEKEEVKAKPENQPIFIEVESLHQILAKFGSELRTLSDKEPRNPLIGKVKQTLERFAEKLDRAQKFSRDYNSEEEPDDEAQMHRMRQ